jgi:cytochrome c biogenesis protein CcmG, thiol:disulfide interchange protein DsbE
MRKLADVHPLVLGTYAVLTVLSLALVAAVVLDGRPTPARPPGLVEAPLDSAPLVAAEATGRQVPGQQFESLAGEVVSLEDYRGRPLVLNLFASWCAPCITEMPELEEVHRELGGEVAFLGLAVSDRTRDVAALVERTKVTYDIGRDPFGTVVVALGNTVMPTTYLIDPGGRVVAARAGAIDAGELRDLIGEHLSPTGSGRR